MGADPRALLVQAGLAALYYISLVVLARLAGKRLAGQTTTFDLLVLIQLGVALQQMALGEGAANAAVFIVVAFAMHRGLAAGCARSNALRRLVRGEARPLIVEGRVSDEALHDESMSYDELLAGLRKLGFASPDEVRLAVLEETGHVSAIGFDKPKTAAG